MREAEQQIIQLLTEIRDDARSYFHDKDFATDAILREQQDWMQRQLKWTNRWLLYFVVCTVCLSVALAGWAIITLSK